MASRKGIENPEYVRSTIENMRVRMEGLQRWLDEDHPECRKEQKHTDREDSPEKAYWHYGYMVALADTIRALTDQPLDERDREVLNKLHIRLYGRPRWPIHH